MAGNIFQLLRMKIRQHKLYVRVVVLPTLIVAIYYIIFASSQYQTEARFFIKSGSPSGNELPSALSVTAGQSAAAAVTLAAVDYLKSPDVLAFLRTRMNLVDMYNKPKLDIFYRLGGNGSEQRLSRYLFGQLPMIDVYVDINSQLGVVKVRAFSPKDAEAIADAMLQGADDLVDRFSKRAEQDTLAVAQESVANAEQELIRQKGLMAAFRARKAIIDPERASAGMTDMISSLSQQLAQAKVDLSTTQKYLDGNSPKVNQLRQQVAALQAQIAAVGQSSTEPHESLASALSGYEQIQAHTQFAEANLTSALSSLENARLEAAKQHLFLVKVVKPTAAEESEYPRRILIIVSAFVVLNVFFGIGWLILVGIKEHVA
ncbi:hypothetical protein ACRS8P_21065 [Burkholderia cenocepacia]